MISYVFLEVNGLLFKIVNGRRVWFVLSNGV